MHEAKMNRMNCFVTLTYDEEHMPYQRQLTYPHFQRFLRKARRKYGAFRFFMAGEYGELHDRPHYHACLFGLSFPRERVVRSDSGTGFHVYESAALSQLWPHGYASVGDLSFESAAYVARYVVKKAGGPADERLMRFDENGVCYWLTPEFSKCSLKPGIGASWWAKYKPEVIARGNLVMRGVEMKWPRYYEKLDVNDDLQGWKDKFIREAKLEEGTPERLKAREIVAKARLEFKKRTMR